MSKQEREGLVSHAEAAAYLGVTPQGLYGMRHKGTGPPGYRVGSRVRYRLGEIDQWLASRRDQERVPVTARSAPTASDL
ncbi:MAG: helix-turn-helix transcriptional regulator [Acidimicrobiales bacterium]